MPDLVLEATAERRCAAPRDTILAWEADPFAAASVDPRTSVADVTASPDVVGTRWTSIAVVAKVLKFRSAAMLMSIDPVIVESLRGRQVATSTCSVGAVPESDGRCGVTYAVSATVPVPRFNYWYASRRRASYERRVARALADYADKSVAAIEAHARATAER